MSGLDTMTTMGVPNKTFDYDGKTIVDCPACKTRFCVKDEILERHSEPNFHCSRCDHVFRLNISELRANKITEEASKTIPTEARPAATIRNFNIPRDVAGGGSISAPHESARNEDRFGTRTLSGQSPMIGAHTSKEIRPRRQLKAIDLLKHVNIFSKKNPSSPNQDDSISSSAPYAAQVKDDNRCQDMLSITTPIIIFLLTLSLVSFYFVKNPGTASSVISAIVPSAPRTTPAGLHITETSFTKVNLDSGEEVAVVTGEIQNKTDAMYGSVILEAQAAGLPVIATKVGGILDLVEDQKTGILVEPGNSDEIAQAILKIYSNPDFSQNLVQNAKINLEKYDWDKIAEKVYSIYQKI